MRRQMDAKLLDSFKWNHSGAVKQWRRTAARDATDASDALNFFYDMSVEPMVDRLRRVDFDRTREFAWLGSRQFVTRENRNKCLEILRRQMDILAFRGRFDLVHLAPA